MLENLLKECYDTESPKEYGSESVKSVVLSRIEKENKVKHFRIKPLIIAAAVTATAAASLVTANAATGGAIARAIGSVAREVSRQHIDASESVPAHTEITYEDGAKAYLPDSYLEKPKTPENIAAPVNSNVPDTAAPAEKYGNAECDTEGEFVHQYSNGEQYAIPNDVKDDSKFRNIGSDTPFKNEVYYYVIEFLDGTKRYSVNFPEELNEVNMMDYGIISYTEGGTGEFYTEVVDGGVICGWRAPGESNYDQ